MSLARDAEPLWGNQIKGERRAEVRTPSVGVKIAVRSGGRAYNNPLQAAGAQELFRRELDPGESSHYQLA